MERGRNELARALACAFLFFLIIGSYYVVKSVRDSILVSKFEAHNHPKVYIAVCIATLPVGALMAFLARRWPRHVLLPVLYCLGGVVYLGFWRLPVWIAGASEPVQQGMRVAIFIWVSVFNLVSICLFWAFTNDLFTREQGKRLYGLIGSGGILGGAVGGWIAQTYAKSLGSFGLVAITAAGLFVCAAVAVLVHFASTKQGSEEPERPRARLRDLPRILASPYVGVIAAIVVLHTFSETTVDLQAKAIGRTVQMDTDSWSSFWGGYNKVMNVFAFVMQIVVATFIHRRWGPRVGLLVLPAATLLLAPLLLARTSTGEVSIPFLGVFPSQLAILALVGIPLQAFSYSIWQSSKELLYVPTDPTVKYQAKAFIDTFGFRLGDTITSFVALIPAGGVAGVGWFAAMGWAGCLVWMALAWRVGSAFETRGAATPPASGTPADP